MVDKKAVEKTHWWCDWPKGKELSNLKPWPICSEPFFFFFFRLLHICKAIQQHIFVHICCISYKLQGQSWRCFLAASGVQHLWALPGGALLRLPVPAEGLACPQEAVSGAQEGAGLGVGAGTMICPDPGEEDERVGGWGRGSVVRSGGK